MRHNTRDTTLANNKKIKCLSRTNTHALTHARDTSCSQCVLCAYMSHVATCYMGLYSSQPVRRHVTKSPPSMYPSTHATHGVCHCLLLLLVVPGNVHAYATYSIYTIAHMREDVFKMQRTHCANNDDVRILECTL